MSASSRRKGTVYLQQTSTILQKTPSFDKHMILSWYLSLSAGKVSKYLVKEH